MWFLVGYDLFSPHGNSNTLPKNELHYGASVSALQAGGCHRPQRGCPQGQRHQGASEVGSWPGSPLDGPLGSPVKGLL